MRLLLQKTATVHMVIIAFVPPFVNIHFEKCLIFTVRLQKSTKKPSDLNAIGRFLIFYFRVIKLA